MNLVERLEMAEELDVTHRSVARQQISDPADLLDQGVHSDVGRAEAPCLRMVPVPGL